MKPHQAASTSCDNSFTEDLARCVILEHFSGRIVQSVNNIIELFLANVSDLSVLGSIAEAVHWCIRWSPAARNSTGGQNTSEYLAPLATAYVDSSHSHCPMLSIGAPVGEGSQRYRAGPDRFLSRECAAPDGQRADGRPARPPYEHRFGAGRQPPYPLPNARSRDGCSRLRAAPEWTLCLGFSRAGFFGPASAVVSDGAAGAFPTIATHSAAHHRCTGKWNSSGGRTPSLISFRSLPAI